MGNFGRLVSIQARGVVFGLVGRGRTDGRPWARILGAGVPALLVAGAAVAYLAALGAGLAGLGLAEAIPLIAALIGSLAGVAFAFAKVGGTLFDLADYDFVAALPIPTPVVVLARMVTLYGSAVALSVLVAAPLYATYFLAVPHAPAAVLAAASGTVVAPVAPVSAAVLAGYLVGVAASRFRHAGAASVALSLVFVAAIFCGAFLLGSVTDGMGEKDPLAALGSVAGYLSTTAAGVYPPATWIADAVVRGSWAGLAATAGVSTAAFALVMAIVTHWYPQLNAGLAARGGARAFNVGGVGDGASPVTALVVKELRRLATLPTYALNCGMGLVLMVLLAVALAALSPEGLLASGAIDGLEVTSGQLVGLGGAIRAVLPWAFGFCAVTALTAAPSVSLEGRAAWVMATLPLSRRLVLAAKLLANLLLGGVVLAFSLVVLLVGGKVGAACALECALVGGGVLAGFASLSLALDARRPNFGFTSANEVVKRGFPMMVGVLGGMAVVAACGFAAFQACVLVGPWAAHVLNVAAPAAIAAAGLTVLLATTREPAIYVG